jgi:hypothetical protein
MAEDTIKPAPEEGNRAAPAGASRLGNKYPLAGETPGEERPREKRKVFRPGPVNGDESGGGTRVLPGR